MVTSFKSRANPIKKYALENQLECYDWLTHRFESKQTNYDLGAVVSFGHLIPENIIGMFPMYVKPLYGGIITSITLLLAHQLHQQHFTSI